MIYTLSAAQVFVYFGGKHLKELQTIQYSVNYGEEAIYGIDSAFPQEIASTRAMLTGQCSLVYLQAEGGLQGKGLTPRLQEILYMPYNNLKIKDRKNGVDILFCPSVKITNETVSISAKGTVKITFNFSGILPYREDELR